MKKRQTKANLLFQLDSGVAHFKAREIEATGRIIDVHQLSGTTVVELAGDKAEVVIRPQDCNGGRPRLGANVRLVYRGCRWKIAKVYQRQAA